jgi:hypothetical protein
MDRLNLTCPITTLIFLEPVSINSGITYEKSAIVRWLQQNSSCPISKKEVDKNMHDLVIVRIFVADYLAKNPDEIKNQYQKSETDCFLILLGDMMRPQMDFENISYDNYDAIMKNINKLNRDTLTELSLHKIFWNSAYLKRFLESHDTTKIDESVEEYTLVSMILMYASAEAVIFAIKLGIPFNIPDKNGLCPIHHMITNYYQCENLRTSQIIDDIFSPDCEYNSNSDIDATTRKIIYMHFKGIIDYAHVTNSGTSLLDMAVDLDTNVVRALYIETGEHFKLTRDQQIIFLNFFVEEEQQDLLVGIDFINKYICHSDKAKMLLFCALVKGKADDQCMNIFCKKNDFDVMAMMTNGMYPLHYALYNGYVADILLNEDTCKRSLLYNLPIIYALRYSSDDIVKKVLTISKWEIFKNVNVEEYALIDMWNEALLLAIRISSVDIVLTIVENISKYMDYSIVQEEQILYYTKKYKGRPTMKKVDEFLMYANLKPNLHLADSEINIPTLFGGNSE